MRQGLIWATRRLLLQAVAGSVQESLIWAAWCRYNRIHMFCRVRIVLSEVRGPPIIGRSERHCALPV